MSRALLRHHFEDIPKQGHAAKLGMWLFLASELLFFSALFSLYAYYRVEHPQVFADGVGLNNRVLGAINTGVLIAGSAFIGTAGNLLRLGRRNAAALLSALTAVAGIVYITIKGVEYAQHFSHGIYPGGVGSFFEQGHPPGYAVFFNLYFGMTGLHIIHVGVGVVAMAWIAWWIIRDQVSPVASYRVVVAGLYWHFLDIIWLYLFPIFYLMGGRS